MGNPNIKRLKIDNFINYKNDLVIAPVNSQLDKEACEKEKQNLKLVSKHNKELKDRDLLENSLFNHFFLRALDNKSCKEIISRALLQAGKCPALLPLTIICRRVFICGLRILYLVL